MTDTYNNQLLSEHLRKSEAELEQEELPDEECGNCALYDECTGKELCCDYERVKP
jgi:hypothetical protein